MRAPDPRPLPFDPIAEAERQWRAHGWGEAARVMAVVTSVMRTQQILLARADGALRAHGLTFARYEVLMLLWFSRRGELPLGTIGRRLQVNAASVTNAVDRLEHQGLVSRVPNPSDGRGTLARLTPEGRSRAAAATEVMNTEVFSGLGVEEPGIDALFDLLRAVRHAAGDFEEPAPDGRGGPGPRAGEAGGEAGARGDGGAGARPTRPPGGGAADGGPPR